MPRNKNQKPLHKIWLIELSQFHEDILRGFCTAWRVTESTAIAALLHAVYSTIETQAQTSSPIQKSLRHILRKVTAAQTTRKGA